MARTRRHTTPHVVLVLVAVLALGVGCGSGQQPDPTTAPTVSTEEQQARDGALVAYEGFWLTTNQAFANPGSKDWRPELSTYSTGQALDAVLLDVENYATFPAHKNGEPSRAPSVDSVRLESPARVTIIDCLDVRNVRLVADKTGADLGDTSKQPPRFRYRAEVVRSAGQDRWLVEVTKPLLDQPC